MVRLSQVDQGVKRTYEVGKASHGVEILLAVERKQRECEISEPGDRA